MANALSEMLLKQLELHTRLFMNATASVSDDHAGTRPNGTTNHIAWITGHIVTSRYMLSNLLGAPASEPFPELFANGKGLVQEAIYPLMHELTRDWPSITTTLSDRIRTMTDTDLKADAPFPVPLGRRRIDLIAYIVHHEAYMIGQLGILRRFFGYEAMKFD